MSIKRYNFRIEGKAAQGQTWIVKGLIECEWSDVQDTVMKSVFHQLTQGKAVFGKPGVGCKGPYDITGMVVAQHEQPQ